MPSEVDAALGHIIYTSWTLVAVGQSRRVERYLDHKLWNHVLASVEQGPRLHSTTNAVAG
ncbi:MAG: hypothetical protein PPHERAN_6065 [uncultured Paraburkholderia sp.]|nr:MAG: hypothetical protein PPHERAN_6065 [uncultured Paraburkholderia sp.]